jgi:hypothetical protein
MSGPKLTYLDIESPCWDHQQDGNKYGYGTVYMLTESGGKSLLEHRAMFETIYGYRPPAVLHTCDNTRCVNPAHLQGGTQAMNNADRARKGRSAKHRPDKRTLTDEQVRGIREDFPILGVVKTARKYGRDANVVYQITSGRTYKDVI